MSVIEKLQKSGALKGGSFLSDSQFFNKKDFVTTEIPIINIALSGRVDGGLTSGLTFLAGESKNFKTMLGLILMKAYLKKYPDAYCLFYDTEFGTMPPYVAAMGIDTTRVWHQPIEHLEELKFKLSNALDAIDRGDKIFVFIDSVGNIASKKEVDDALDEKSVADMTRAKVMKSLWRIVTPLLTTKDIPCVAINHTYNTMELYSKAIMSGGTGGMYSANQVFIITKAQEKDGTNLEGYRFTINIEKSRFVREKAKFPFTVLYKGGIDRWSGLFDIALEGDFIKQISAQKYSTVDPETGEISEQSWKKKEMVGKNFWTPIITHPKFNEYLKERYQLGNDSLIQEEDTE